MRRLNPLTLAGIVAALAGICGALAAVRSVDAFIVGFCIQVEMISLALTVGFWRSATHHGSDALASLSISWLATLPGIALLLALPQHFSHHDGYLVFAVNLLWLLGGPLLFFVSAVIYPLRRGPGSLAVVRVGHWTAWLSASLVTTLCAGSL